MRIEYLYECPVVNMMMDYQGRSGGERLGDSREGEALQRTQGNPRSPAGTSLVIVVVVVVVVVVCLLCGPCIDKAFLYTYIRTYATLLPLSCITLTCLHTNAGS